MQIEFVLEKLLAGKTIKLTPINKAKFFKAAELQELSLTKMVRSIHSIMYYNLLNFW